MGWLERIHASRTSNHTFDGTQEVEKFNAWFKKSKKGGNVDSRSINPAPDRHGLLHYRLFIANDESRVVREILTENGETLTVSTKKGSLSENIIGNIKK